MFFEFLKIPMYVEVLDNYNIFCDSVCCGHFWLGFQWRLSFFLVLTDSRKTVMMVQWLFHLIPSSFNKSFLGELSAFSLFFLPGCNMISWHTGLHTKKAYTHTGTSSSQCVHQNCRHFSRQPGFLLLKCKFFFMLFSMFCIKILCMHWLEEVPVWVYACLVCKPVDNGDKREQPFCW